MKELSYVFWYNPKREYSIQVRNYWPPRQMNHLFPNVYFNMKIRPKGFENRVSAVSPLVEQAYLQKFIFVTKPLNFSLAFSSEPLNVYLNSSTFAMANA